MKEFEFMCMFTAVAAPFFLARVGLTFLYVMDVHSFTGTRYQQHFCYLKMYPVLISKFWW